MSKPLVTVVIPSFNQALYLEKAISSVLEQKIPVELFVLDGGSTDNSVEIISRFENKISRWRSIPDAGQAAAINEGISWGTAPFVCWLNSDDWFLPYGLTELSQALQASRNIPVVYGNVLNYKQRTKTYSKVWVQSFNEFYLRQRCIISQPGSLIRRSVWESVEGLNETFHMAMDYDLWWKIYRKYGALTHLNKPIAVNRVHSLTKTSQLPTLHYEEAMKVVKFHTGGISLKWRLMAPLRKYLSL